MREVNVFQVDAFSEQAFGGNPAGVVLKGGNLSQEDMQKIAKEMNLSETVFVGEIQGDTFTIRFFTPLCEVDLCGHGTIATFHTLCEKNYIKPIENGIKTVYQDTKAGKLGIDLSFVDSKIDAVFMEQGKPEEIGKLNELKELCNSLNIAEKDIGVLDEFLHPQIISTGLPDIILPIKEKKTLDNLNVNMEALSNLSKDLGVIGLHAFHLPNMNSEIVYTRNFAPLVGIQEEAATGTSNGALIYYLKKNNLLKGDTIISNQGASMNRPSRIHCKIDTSKEPWLVKVGGKSKIVLEKKLSF